MTPAAAARARALVAELQALLDAEDASTSANDATLRVSKPKRMPRRVAARPRGPVDATLVDRAKDNLRRRGFQVNDGGRAR